MVQGWLGRRRSLAKKFLRCPRRYLSPRCRRDVFCYVVPVLYLLTCHGVVAERASVHGAARR